MGRCGIGGMQDIFGSQKGGRDGHECICMCVRVGVVVVRILARRGST